MDINIFSVKPTKDGGFIGHIDSEVRKYNSLGKEVWKYIGYGFSSLRVTESEGVYAISDGAIRKLSVNGELLWQYSLSYASTIKESVDKQFVYFIGEDNSNDNSAYLTKLSNQGELIWKKSIPYASWLLETNEGTLFVTTFYQTAASDLRSSNFRKKREVII